MVYDPRRLMADALSQKELQDMQEKIAASIRTAGTSVYHTDAINKQTAENTLARKEMKEADLVKNYQNQLSLDFKDEVNRQLTLFTDAKNIDAKTPDGRRELERESEKINSALTNIASIAAANISFLNTKTTLRQVQAAMQNKEAALDKNGQPILKEANSQIYALTTSGVYLPANQGGQTGNPAAPPPPAPAAPAAPVPQQRTQAVPSGSNPYTTTSRSKGTSLNQAEIDQDLKAYQTLKADPRVGGKLKTQELNRLELKLKAAGVID
jgi:hypothetical protein